MIHRTITEALQADHVAVLRDLSRAIATPSLIPKLYPGIANALRRHDHAEAATLYRTLSAYPVEASQIRTSEAEHQQIGRLLDRMDQISYADPNFYANLRELQRLLDAHLAVETTQVFNAARTLLPLSRQYQLAQRYEIKMGRGRISNVSLVVPTIGRPRRGVLVTNPQPVVRRPWWQHFVGTFGVFHRGR